MMTRSEMSEESTLDSFFAFQIRLTPLNRAQSGTNIPCRPYHMDVGTGAQSADGERRMIDTFPCDNFRANKVEHTEI